MAVRKGGSVTLPRPDKPAADAPADAAPAPGATALKPAKPSKKEG